MTAPRSAPRTLYFLLLILALLLASCAAGGSQFSAVEPAGFFSGIWHGWIAPFAIIAHFFKPEVRIYEPDNTGILYDIGFYVAVISGFGSIGLSRRKAKKGRG